MSDTPDDAADPRIGKLVDDRYKILEAMASGAMGAVYRAERVPVGKAVAVKFLHASYAKDAEFLIRFERETRAMSKLAHPNCVSVVDFGVFEDAPYLVMEYVAGSTLRKLLDDEELAPARALGFARQIAAGLAHAHAQGIVHRDIKPANIMITDEIGAGEHVRLLDFGLARLRGAGGRDATLGNVVVGTPNYMAPEQTVPGGTIDARTDIYAAGVMLFEMIAGERPFFAEDTMTLFGLHRGAPIPKLVDKMPEGASVPEGAQLVIDTAMAKAPKARYQTAVELATAIEAVIEGGRAEAAMRQAGSANLAAPTAAAAAATGPTAVVARRRTDKADAVAPTLLNVEPSAPALEVSAASHDLSPARGNMRTGLIALGLIALVGAGTAYVIHRSNSERTHPADAPVVAIAPPIDAAPVPEPDAAVAVVDAAEAIDAGSGSGTGSGADEIEMDPATAEDLDPHAGSAAEDEAADAPATAADVEKRAPRPDMPATNIHDALGMIKDGKRDLALASLRAIWKKEPASAYIPFLLGNLYFDQRWWSVAMEHYRAAIAKNPEYKNNPTLIRNIIRMLASTKTQAGASLFLHRTIGHPAAAYLKNAATHEDNPIVRRQAAALAKTIH